MHYRTWATGDLKAVKYSVRPSGWMRGLLSIKTKLYRPPNLCIPTHKCNCVGPQRFYGWQKSSAKRKGGLMAMLSGVNFPYTMYTWTVTDFLVEPFFRWLNFTFSLDPIHCSTNLSVRAGAVFYFSKLRLCWSLITVGNRSTIDMLFK